MSTTGLIQTSLTEAMFIIQKSHRPIQATRFNSKDEHRRVRSSVLSGQCRVSLRTYLDLGFHRANVDIRMDVRCTTEVPYEARTFDSPHVPDFVVAEITILVERHMKFVGAAV